MAKDTPSKWNVKGELALNCSCDVFCPCVISLGAHPPTDGHCHAWMAIRIDDGKFGRTNLGGLNVAFLLDIPGRMGEGNWTVGLYIDERATDKQFEAIETIMTGSAKGSTGVLRLLVGNYLGARREEVHYETDGQKRVVKVPKVIDGAIEPIPGGAPDEPVVVKNTQYWIAPDITIARGLRGRVRDFGRVWNFDQKSAELCDIEWVGP